jgi:hypothetical protein
VKSYFFNLIPALLLIKEKGFKILSLARRRVLQVENIKKRVLKFRLLLKPAYRQAGYR